MANSCARSSFRPKIISAAVSACFIAGTAAANPTGSTVVSGTASISQNGNLLQITNSPNAILNWQNFSIGANEITRFVQQSASSAVLNRVVTQNPSTILGALQSNGRVFIINPNGILFGAGAQVDVAGLVASPLNLGDSDFLAGRMRFTDGIGASVVNHGSITTGAGGNVYLVGSAVTNSGIITSPRGEVILAAGNSVQLVNPGTPNLRVEIAAANNQAINMGQILSDAGRVGIYAGLINNSGAIRADSAVSEGGRILLKATNSVTLESGGVLSAQGLGGGEIKVLAGDSVHVAGRLDASAPINGDGGVIETSAKKVHVESGTSVTTAAPDGKTGTWLIDPADFNIAAQNGDITGLALSTQLSRNNVVIASDDGSVVPIGNGDIFVNDSVTWIAPNSLTLLARHNVELNSSISGGGDLVFLAGWNGDLQSPLVVSGVGDITNNLQFIQTRGSVFFEAGRNILLGGGTVAAGAVAAGSGLVIDGLSKTVQLIAGRNISFTDPNGVVSRVLAIGNIGSSAAVTIQAKNGAITMNGSELLATGGGIGSVAGGSASVALSAGGGIELINSTASANGAGGLRGGGGTATLVAGSGITLSGSTVNASGGGGSIGPGGNATVTLRTGGDIALASSVNANAGAGASANGTAQIFLTFLTPGGNFSVNGVPGAIVDTTSGRVGEGFFVNGMPAIQNVNFFVTGVSSAPVFTDTLVATMNQQADVLADQLRAGQLVVADQNDEKKLSVCN